MSSHKRKPLDTAALAAASVQQPDPVQLAVAKAVVPEQPKRAGGSRAGRVQIQGHFPEETRRALKMLAVRQDRTVEDLLGEAIADVLAKYSGSMN
jgi:hypothetical protein